ncbi:hypothetical protein EIP91_005923 [Steccherinum ochraceum]|uniref:N-acetyltransferase domain-containing protein n=1 Tax=Steccherinum ochraceum TaxID=92696 RepID=A0A4R0RQ30_9APHY|nr:hypothetical protein EIP91_005923 [Steccherinum ochraceum]
MQHSQSVPEFPQEKRKEPHLPRKVAYEDLWNAAKTAKISTVNDPLNRYIFEHRSNNKWLDLLDRIIIVLAWTKFPAMRTGWTVDAGDALMLYDDPAKATPPLWYKLVLRVVTVFSRLVRSPEQRRRGREFESKITAAIKETLGDRAKDMFNLAHLATSPAKQGRGYGTAVCKALTTEADERKLASYVVSSNVKGNTPFYNYLGYYTVAEILLGEDDPSWKEPPVPIALMVRELPSVDSKV